MRLETLDLHRLEVGLAADRVDRTDLDAQRRQSEYRRVREVLDHDLCQRDIAEHHEGLRFLLDRGEGEREPGVELARGQLEFERHRRIVEVLGKLERVEIDPDRSLVRVMKRLGLAGELERRVVHFRREERLDVDLGVTRDGRDERDADADVGHRMLVLLRTVVEVDPAVRELDVVDREPWRWALGLRLRHCFVDQVLEVVRLVLVADDPQVRLHQADPVDHRSEPEHRPQGRVDVELLEGERRLGAGAVFHDEATHGDRERVRVEPQRLDRHLALELLRERCDEVGLGDRRDDQEADDTDRDDDPEDPPADAARARGLDEAGDGCGGGPGDVLHGDSIQPGGCANGANGVDCRD